MASFRGHVSLGVATGVVMSVAALGLPVAFDPAFVFSVFWLAVLGSFLPDIDSDSGLPFNISFGAFTLLLVGYVLRYSWAQFNGSLLEVVFACFGALLFSWFVLGSLFKKFTKHRGMAHSIPAAFLSGVSVFFFAAYLHFTDLQSFILALSVSAGFLGHLIMDEIWAAVNFQGKLFVPNKALGSALKMYSDSRLANGAVYAAIIFFLSGNTSRFLGLWNEVWNIWKEKL